MNLAVKASRGYAMAALLVAMSVMAVLLSVALPAWSQLIRREKEEELIFRGTQYARAINLYQRKFANASPASIDLLLEQRLLRKKFKDPLSPNEDGEFQLLYVNTQAPAAGRGGPGAPAQGSATGANYGTKPSGGIVGVASKNTGQSLRTYKGKQHYNEWQFIGMEQSTQAGRGEGGAGRGGIGGRGGRGGPFDRGGSGRDGGARGAGRFGEGGRGGGPLMPRGGPRP